MAKDLLLREITGAKERPNERYFDRFSIAHAATGAVLELASIPAPIALGGQVVFEVFENDIKRAYGRFFPQDQLDAWQNSVGDILSFAVGYYGARAIKSNGAGKVALIGLAALSGGLWVSELLKHKWNQPPR